MLTVGILGATGFMGAPFARALIKAHRAGQLRFVILHRPESNVNRFPPDIDQRCIDLQNGSLDATAAALKDLQVVMFVASVPSCYMY
jgi:nucleoside-diphosphate-sugar epimerase